MTALLGSPYWPDFSGAILVFEDVGEAPYRIDNYLSQLANAGVLRQIAGVIAGQFTDCEPEEGKPSLSIEEILDDYFAPLNIPRVQNFDYGHGRIKHTLPLGVRFRIRTAPATVEALEGAVV
jgi:muramoyltetrapeptide carboxypeptidase